MDNSLSNSLLAVLPNSMLSHVDFSDEMNGKESSVWQNSQSSYKDKQGKVIDSMGEKQIAINEDKIDEKKLYVGTYTLRQFKR